MLVTRYPQVEITDDVRKRFPARVHKTSIGCWLWLGCRTDTGYGQIYIGGRPYRAHRIAYEMATGQFPGDLFVCHTCDNPSCVNPEHLFLGTVLDNTRDMHAKGRAAFPMNTTPCRKCGHDRSDDYVETRPGGRTESRCRNCIRLRDERRRPLRAAKARAAKTPIETLNTNSPAIGRG